MMVAGWHVGPRGRLLDFGPPTMRRTLRLPILVVLALVASCSTFPGVIPAVGAPHTYGTSAELADAVRNSVLSDGTMTFTAKYHLKSLSVTDGSGALAIGLSETDTKMHLTAGTADPGSDLVSLGRDVYSRTSAGGSASWTRSTIDEYVRGGPFVVDLLLLTRIDATAPEMSLTGPLPVPGTPNLTYHLHGTWQSAVDGAMRVIGSSATAYSSGKPTPLDLAITLDPSDRLVGASWTTGSQGLTSRADYTFADWAKPVTIAPVG
jgi:hypothetical protein